MKPQIEQLEQKWKALPAGDQKALGILGVFLGSLFVVYGLFLPAKHYFDNAQTRAEEASELLGWMESQRPALAQIGSRREAPRATGTLLQRVTAAAEQRKIAIKRFEPEGDGRIRLWIERARYQDFQPWLNGLLQQGVSIHTVNMDALDEEGMVSARLTLEG
ncbi:type II secretion system protein M [Microbulbifer flavimaris]|uniref:Type II secretion system protein M n=1 Tax=Microbulbifer flavimaris TaxID=1781068 RepID=A0ABX4I3B6_9GAMM|nr:MULTISPECIES: type II secretion system protein M [Microbulbifer]KUJ84808.1 general secretion pathway protein GspM [Microbulbifer sp. ZGT114]PCO06905.1 type II secretion system protein M [Microbulbifer flavimaris]